MQHALEGVAVVIRAGRRHRFEEQQHAAREVLVGVLVEPDAAGERLHVHLRTERALAAGQCAVQAHDVGEVAEVRGDGRAGEIRVEGELRARYGLHLGITGGALGGGVEQEPVEVAHARHLGPPPAAEEHHARLLRQADLA